MDHTLIYNRQVKKQYQVLETIEAGLVLIADEAKNLRSGRGQIVGTFGRIFSNKKGQPEVWLLGIKISRQDQSPRSIKLLLNRREINRLIGSSEAKNQSLVPLRIYSKKGKIKVELALVRGKEHRDRREEIKKRDLDRQMRRENV